MRYIVLGLGKAGGGICKFLLANNETVFGYDKDDTKLKNFADFSNFTAASVKDLEKLAKEKNMTVITSPSIEQENPLLTIFLSKGIPVIDEIEFVYNHLKDKTIVGITGTNGKSTTTALIGEILRADNRSVFYGGNLAPGEPASNALSKKAEYNIFEVSSFQLERIINFRPKIAVLLNITPDHLDRHKSFSHYQNLKLKIFQNQKEDDFAVLNLKLKKLYNFQGHLFTFDLKEPTADAYFEDGWLYLKRKNQKLKIIHSDEIILPGLHNQENILAALLAALILNVKEESVIKVLKSFKGLPHRLEFVLEKDGVKYINNSMCTNPAAGIASLMAFSDKPVVLITGGKEKSLSYLDYLLVIKRKAEFTILFGENAKKLAKELKEVGYENFFVADSLKEAVKEARHHAQFGSIVLFSPAFASYDYFTDFIERGEKFKSAVFELCCEVKE